MERDSPGRGGYSDFAGVGDAVIIGALAGVVVAGRAGVGAAAPTGAPPAGFVVDGTGVGELGATARPGTGVAVATGTGLAGAGAAPPPEPRAGVGAAVAIAGEEALAEGTGVGELVPPRGGDGTGVGDVVAADAPAAAGPWADAALAVCVALVVPAVEAEPEQPVRARPAATPRAAPRVTRGVFG